MTTPSLLHENTNNKSKILSVLNIGQLDVNWRSKRIICAETWRCSIKTSPKYKQKNNKNEEFVIKYNISNHDFIKVPWKITSYINTHMYDARQGLGVDISKQRASDDPIPQIILPLKITTTNYGGLNYCNDDYISAGCMIVFKQFGIFVCDRSGMCIWTENPTNDSSKYRFDYNATKYHLFHKNLIERIFNSEIYTGTTSNVVNNKSKKARIYHVVDSILYINYLFYFGKVKKARNYMNMIKTYTKAEYSEITKSYFELNIVNYLICLLLNQICLLDMLEKDSPKILNIGKLT